MYDHRHKEAGTLKIPNYSIYLKKTKVIFRKLSLRIYLALVSVRCVYCYNLFLDSIRQKENRMIIEKLYNLCLGDIFSIICLKYVVVVADIRWKSYQKEEIVFV